MSLIFILQYLVCGFIFSYLVRLLFLKRRASYIGRNLKPLPGPASLPILGHVQLFFKKEPYKYLTELGRNYDGIYQLQIGVKTVIVLNSLDVIREALNEWLFTGRPHLHSFDAFNSSNNRRRLGFITYSTEWKFLRKNAIKGLMLFASSKNSRLQTVVYDAINSFHQDVMKNLDRPFKPKESISETISGIIGAINYGLQFDRKDPLLAKLVQLADIIGRFIQFASFLDYFPMGTFLMQNKVKKFLEDIEPLNTFTENAVRLHKPNDQVTDVADALYKRRLETSEEELKEAHVDAEEIQLLSQDLFAAGFATTMETFLWSMTLMAAYPDVQTRMAAELKKQIKSGIQPTLNDMKSTPYTEATLLEIFRFVSFVPLNLPHSTISEGEFRGYYIPANAVVITNLWNVHHEPLVFDEPFEFRPERFLFNDGSLNVDLAQLIAPFSIGKRRCVGENLARQELYLLLSATVMKFQIRPAPGECIDVHDVDPGFNRRVKQYKLKFSLRE